MGVKFSSPLSGCFGHPDKSEKRAKTSEAEDVVVGPPSNKSLAELQQEVAADSAALALLQAEIQELWERYHPLRQKRAELLQEAAPIRKKQRVTARVEKLEKKLREAEEAGSKLRKDVERKQAQVHAYATFPAATKTQLQRANVSGLPLSFTDLVSTHTQAEVAAEQSQPCGETDGGFLFAKLAGKEQDVCDFSFDCGQTETISTAVDVTVVPTTVRNTPAYAERLAALKQLRLGARRSVLVAKQATTQPTDLPALGPAAEPEPAEPVTTPAPQEALSTAASAEPLTSLAAPSARDSDRRARLARIAEQRQSKSAAAATPQPPLSRRWQKPPPQLQPHQPPASLPVQSMRRAWHAWLV